MPVIPFAPTSPSAVPSGGGPLPQADIGAMTAPARAAASGFAQVGQEVGGFAQQYLDAKLQVDAADQSSDLTKRLQELQFKASKVPDRQQATAMYDQGAAEIRQQYEQSGANPFVKQHVLSRLGPEIALRRAAAQREAFTLESETQRGKLVTQLNDWNKQGSEAADPRLMDKMIQDGNAAIDGRVAGGWMSPEAGARAKIDFESGVLKNRITLAMAKDMRTGLALYNLYKPRLNAQDSQQLGIQAEDKQLELDAETMINKRLPVMASGYDNNIGNITTSAFKYAGGKGQPHGPFETFQSPEHGVAAAYQTVKAKADQAGGTISFQDLIAGNSKVKGWASAPDGSGDPLLAGNNPAAYASVLAKSVGMNAGDNVPLGDDVKMAQVLKAMNVHEKGRQTVKDEMYGRGIKLAQGDQTIAPTGPQGDALAQFSTEAAKYEMELLADQNMDPRLRARALSMLQQRTRATQSFVLSDRKQIDDAGETAALGLFNGSYVDGTFAGLAQRYRDSGDNSKASVYDFLAANEGPLKDFARLPPGAQRILGHVLPGAAGRIGVSILTDQRADRTEMRQEAARQHALVTKGLQEGVDPLTLGANARDAASYYIAAGDRGHAQAVIDEYTGAVQGQRAGGLPTAQAQAELDRLREIASSSSGLDVRTSAALQVMQKAIEKNRELWKNDPLTAAAGARMTAPLVPWRPDLQGANLQLWVNQRRQQASQAQYALDPGATVQAVPLMTQGEIDQAKTHLLKGGVQDRQIGLATMATALPDEQVPLIAKRLAGNDKLGDAWATAMAFYKRAQPGDRAIGDSLIEGSNRWVEGGPEGREKLQLKPEIFAEINSSLGTARAGMDGRDLDMQNNAIAARYVSLMGSKADQAYDSTVLRQAVKDIVGQSTRINGADTLVPTGVEPYQFRDGLAALTDADLPPLQQPPSGQTLDARRVRDFGTFQPVGDGIYRIWMPDPKGGHTVELRRADTGKPVEISIRPLIARGIPARTDVPPELQ